MKKINENTKVTLTLGQLKKLVKEARKAPMWKKLDVELFRKAKRALRQYGDDDMIDLDSLYVKDFTDFNYLSDEYGFDAGNIVEAAVIGCNQEAIDFFLDIAANLMPDCKVVTDNKYEIYVVKFANKAKPEEPNQASAPTANTDESMPDETEDGVESDVDKAVADLFDMYRACKVEPKVCNAIKADGEKTSIFLDKGNSVGGVARALRDGRLLKVIGFN